MKRLFIIILVMGVCFPDSWAQDEITEENYLRQDSILWDCYYKREAELSRLWKELPEEKHDSLRQVYTKYLKGCYNIVYFYPKQIAILRGSTMEK